MQFYSVPIEFYSLELGIDHKISQVLAFTDEAVKAQRERLSI